MRVRDLPPDQLCDACLAAITAMTTDDELALLKALCADCEGKVAGHGRPADAIGWKSGEVVDFETGEVMHTMKRQWIRRSDA